MNPLIPSAALALFVASTLSACGSSGGGGSSSDVLISTAQADTTSDAPSTKDLSAFVDTYWYVPTAYLQAYRYVPATSPRLTQVTDQTVWHITSVSNGYLIGCAFTAIDGTGASWSAATLVGSVSANNIVSIGFYSTTGVIVGQGTLTTANSQPAFLMQMSAMPTLVGITHWAYMLPVTTTDAAWTSLPGTSGVSVSTATAAGCG